ncbi:UNVERIFIED_CONTAM: Alpha/beta hydrolase domain-containing protein WAV2 [Sesamum calycinum]|uniref:Alpha/beta hydrolase domain-containing protein WAV2 n=1 Tax=Sesamum calycinum TaxID=2727403 RepID=A0AAW2N148_9LAMI
MVSYVSALLYGVGGIVMAGMALLVTFQEKLIYVPVLPGLSKSYPITPARFRLLYEDVWLTSSDGVRLHSWFIKPFPDFRGLFLDFRVCVIVLVGFDMCKLSYGASAGFPSQHGITLDAQAALDHLVQRTDIDTSRIVVFGRSLGGAVGAVVTRNNPDQVAALILENTFTSILDMAGVAFPFLKWFIGSSSKGLRVLNFVVRSPWSTIDVIDEIKQPVLFLSGLQDEIVPPSHMEMLYVKAAAHNQQCLFVEFPTGKHMDTWLVGSDRYWTTIQEFLEKNVPDKKDRDSSRVVPGDKLQQNVETEVEENVNVIWEQN